MALSTEQILLLNNLMYIEPQEGTPFQTLDGFDGCTIGEWLDCMDLSHITEMGVGNNYMTGEDWQNIIQAVRQDDTLLQMKIVATHIDNAAGGGNGRSAVFISEETNDAVVTFKGTESPNEWKDNFQGGNTTDTAQQQNALEWYQEVYQECGLDCYDVTVTGHSKGGNKAKYITILDDTVDDCVSFDGQGFSDEFMEKYASDIASNQNKIENHNVDADYVNILLNDVGNTTYYKGYEYGEGGFLENHCPNTFMEFSEDGSFSMTVNPDGQNLALKELDKFLNSYMRSMSDEKREDALMMVNTILDYAFSFDENTSGSDIANIFLQMFADKEYSDDLAYLIAYTIKYEQGNPELLEQINTVLQDFGLGEFTKYVDIVNSILDFECEILPGIKIDFDMLYGILTGAINLVGVMEKSLLFELSVLLKTLFGIELTIAQIRKLIQMTGLIWIDMQSIQIVENGQDIVIESPTQINDIGLGTCYFQIDLQGVRASISDLQHIKHQLEQSEGELAKERAQFTLSSAHRFRIEAALQAAQKELVILQKKTTQTEQVLNEILELYETAEKKIAGFCV